eukprot:SAG31_NODE_6241_length_2106_cov_10.479322_3_plen_53_part_01
MGITITDNLVELHYTGITNNWRTTNHGYEMGRKYKIYSGACTSAAHHVMAGMP